MTRLAPLRQLASALALLAVVLAGESCLNPRPEELPSAQPLSPENPQMMGSTGNDPGIGGDDLPLDDGDDDAEGMGQTPSNVEGPRTPDNMGVPPSGIGADAGVTPGGGLPAPDAGADGG